MLGTLLDTKVVGLPLEGSMQGWIVILIVTSSKQNREGKKNIQAMGTIALCECTRSASPLAY